MRRFPIKTLQLGLLIVILSAYLRSLAKDAVTLRQLHEAKQRVMNNAGLPDYGNPQGIDVYGHPIALKSKHTIICVLRAASIQHDVELWNTLATLLAMKGDIKVLGYCETSKCVTLIRDQYIAKFPVLQAGDAIAIQAAIAADANGKAVITKVGSGISTLLLWRDGRRSPEELLAEVGQ
jgi:hypothetical protein